MLEWIYARIKFFVLCMGLWAAAVCGFVLTATLNQIASEQAVIVPLWPFGDVVFEPPLRYLAISLVFLGLGIGLAIPFNSEVGLEPVRRQWAKILAASMHGLKRILTAPFNR
ncbi:MAG TPA: hypothetical protein VLT15_04375 [Acidimicrobiia bacterium]|nr:hypothetical protein [Acidimicrobiia bacterium]